MDLTLTYRGLLPASQQGSSKVAEKHAIRECFSRQLKKKFATHATLVNWSRDPGRAVLKAGKVVWAADAAKHVSCFCDVEAFGYTFRSVVAGHNGLACHLDIELWSRELHGVLLSDGDLDNRLKTLIDSLTMPRHENQIPAIGELSPDPTFCLLEDDSLVTKLSVSVERWDEEPAPGERPAVVQVRVRAHIEPYEPRAYHFGF